MTTLQKRRMKRLNQSFIDERSVTLFLGQHSKAAYELLLITI